MGRDRDRVISPIYAEQRKSSTKPTRGKYRVFVCVCVLTKATPRAPTRYSTSTVLTERKERNDERAVASRRDRESRRNVVSRREVAERLVVSMML